MSLAHTLGLLALAAGCATHGTTPAVDSPPAPTDEAYDPATGVTWLADANLAAANRFGLPLCGTPPCVNASGSMTYASAVAWVAAMNAGAGYLGHTDWQLPTTPNLEPGCTSKGPKPNQNDFAFECKANALGSLYYGRFGLDAPATAVAIPATTTTTTPFENFQPYLYWTGTQKMDKQGTLQGNSTLSFATGFQGANTQFNFLYVLPMIPGPLPGTPVTSSQGLQVSPDGKTVYDPIANVTWLRDANLGATNPLGLPRCTAWNLPSPCIADDGAMDLAAATAFITALNAGSGYLGHATWQLPPADLTCDASFGCIGTDNPLSELYTGQLALAPGTPVAPVPETMVDGFVHLQPYLYWSCQGAAIAGPCAGEPATNFQWTFSFGDGFLGTDLDANEMYVAVYRVGA